MLKNKAQIARESIKTTLELPGPLSGPWTPAESEFGSALVMCVLAHNLLSPPPPQMKILDLPLTQSDTWQFSHKEIFVLVNITKKPQNYCLSNTPLSLSRNVCWTCTARNHLHCIMCQLIVTFVKSFLLCHA